MDLIHKLVHTALDQVIEFAEIPPPLIHAWSSQSWTDVIFAGASFTPHIVLLSGLIWLLVSPNLVFAYCFAGLFANKFLNLVLKYAIRQPRPPNPWKSGYGMPSDHAQFMGFIAIFAFCLYAFLQRHRQDVPLNPVVLLGTSALTIFVSYSRLAVGVHSVSQVVFGFLIGGAFAIVWYSLGMILYYTYPPVQPIQKYE